MRAQARRRGGGRLWWITLLAAALAVTGAAAQERGTPHGEWWYQSADAWGTRYSPLDQIDGGNFEDLEVAWVWRGDNFSPHTNYASRSTPSYVKGVLYTVAGYRRTVVAMDPATGETLWTYREPNTTRWEQSMRAAYGKGVSYAEIDGRGVIFVVTPAFFLHALDAKTGQHVEGFGSPVDLPGEYTVFIDLQAAPWEFVVSRWPAQLEYDFDDRDALWGAYEYTPDRDVVRAPMTVETLDHSFDQLSWQFLDVTDAGGALALIWERTLASVRFRFASE